MTSSRSRRTVSYATCRSRARCSLARRNFTGSFALPIYQTRIHRNKLRQKLQSNTSIDYRIHRNHLHRQVVHALHGGKASKFPRGTLVFLQHQRKPSYKIKCYPLSSFQVVDVLCIIILAVARTGRRTEQSIETSKSTNTTKLLTNETAEVLTLFIPTNTFRLYSLSSSLAVWVLQSGIQISTEEIHLLISTAQ